MPKPPCPSTFSTMYLPRCNFCPGFQAIVYDSGTLICFGLIWVKSEATSIIVLLYYSVKNSKVVSKTRDELKLNSYLPDFDCLVPTPTGKGLSIRTKSH